MNSLSKMIPVSARLVSSVAALTLAFLMSLSPITGQSGGIFAIEDSVIGGGSSEMSGGNVEVVATAGQPASGGNIGGGQFSVTSGFWNFTALAPTAAGVSISGRVVTAGGVGISNARLFLQTQSGQMFVSRSGSFGYYMFENIEAGQTVFVTVEHKLHNFEPHTVMVVDSISDLDFTPLP